MEHDLKEINVPSNPEIEKLQQQVIAIVVVSRSKQTNPLNCTKLSFGSPLLSHSLSRFVSLYPSAFILHALYIKYALNLSLYIMSCYRVPFSLHFPVGVSLFACRTFRFALVRTCPLPPGG